MRQIHYTGAMQPTYTLLGSKHASIRGGWTARLPDTPERRTGGIWSRVSVRQGRLDNIISDCWSQDYRHGGWNDGDAIPMWASKVRKKRASRWVMG